MNSLEIIEYLKSEASEKYKNNIVRMGIPAEYCIGVSTAILRNFAKKLKKSSFYRLTENKKTVVWRQLQQILSSTDVRICRNYCTGFRPVR